MRCSPGPWQQPSILQVLQQRPYYEVMQKLAEGEAVEVEGSTRKPGLESPGKSRGPLTNGNAVSPPVLQQHGSFASCSEAPTTPTSERKASGAGTESRLGRKPSLQRLLRRPRSWMRLPSTPRRTAAQASSKGGATMPRPSTPSAAGDGAEQPPQPQGSPADPEESPSPELLEQLSTLESRHMRTVESWMAQAVLWDNELTLPQLAKATPVYEAEEGMARRRVQQSAVAHDRALSDYEDLLQAVVAAKSKLQCLVNTRRQEDRPELPENVFPEACTNLKELTDRAAEAQLQCDVTAAQYNEVVAELQRSQNENARFLPYFIAKWEHEAKIIVEMAQIDALRTRLESAVRRVCNDVCAPKTSPLADAKLIGPQGAAAGEGAHGPFMDAWACKGNALPVSVGGHPVYV